MHICVKYACNEITQQKQKKSVCIFVLFTGYYISDLVSGSDTNYDALCPVKSQTDIIIMSGTVVAQ